MSSADDPIASAERHLRACAQRIARQQSLIDQAEKAGLDTSKARRLLPLMQQRHNAASRALRLALESRK